MQSTKDKIDINLISAKAQQNLEKTNYCIPDILSKCSAGTSWNEQKICKYAIKSDYSNKCMYFIESIDGHCDCMDAQKDALRMV